MNLIKKNIIANFAGNIWKAIIGLVFVPLYIKFLGIEAYGLVGIFASLQAIFALLDMGLGATINREMARLSALLPSKEQEMRDLVRSLEIIYWCIAIIIGVIVVSIAPLIANHWLKSNQLPVKTIEQVLMIIGLVMAIQWPVSFYSGGLMGLQRQVLLNGINICIGTFRGVGAVMVLWLISPTIYAFFTWQLISSAVNVSFTCFSMWHSLPGSGKRPSFQMDLIYGVWRYAAGMNGITILVTLLTQADKIILSKMLTLEMFGYYTLASVVAMALYRFIEPIASSIYPQFTQLVALDDKKALVHLYHKACQFMSVLILPIAAVVVMFSYEILLLWTQNPISASNTYLIVSILISGTVLNGLITLPYALQLAHGWTSLTLYTNMISVVIIIPLTIFMTKYYGAVGGACAWLILNCGYVTIAIQFMYRRLLPTEKGKWYREDIGIPFITAFLAAGLGRLLIEGSIHMEQSFRCLLLLAVSTFTLLMTIMATPLMRKGVLNHLMKLKLEYVK